MDVSPQLSQHDDPFDTIDSGPDPAVEEKILLGRMEGHYYQAILDWFFQRLPASAASVLEVGCGTGQVLDRLAKFLGGVERVTGVDRSAYLAERAAGRFPDYEIFAADGGAIPLPDAQFDITFTSTVLVHAADPSAILDEMYRLTRPGGTAAVLDQDFGSAVIYPGERETTRQILDAAADFWQEGWIGRKLPALMQRAGFQVTDFQATVRVDRELDLPFFTRIRDWVVSAGFSADKADGWLNDLSEGAARNEFVFTRNFYACTARRDD